MDDSSLDRVISEIEREIVAIDARIQTMLDAARDRHGRRDHPLVLAAPDGDDAPSVVVDEAAGKVYVTADLRAVAHRVTPRTVVVKLANGVLDVTLDLDRP